MKIERPSYPSVCYEHRLVHERVSVETEEWIHMDGSPYTTLQLRVITLKCECCDQWVEIESVWQH